MTLDEAKVVLASEASVYRDAIEALPDRTKLNALDDVTRSLIETRVRQLTSGVSPQDRERLNQALRFARVELSRLAAVARDVGAYEIAVQASDYNGQLGERLV